MIILRCRCPWLGMHPVRPEAGIRDEIRGSVAEHLLDVFAQESRAVVALGAQREIHQAEPPLERYGEVVRAEIVGGVRDRDASGNVYVFQAAVERQRGRALAHARRLAPERPMPAFHQGVALVALEYLLAPHLAQQLQVALVLVRQL